MYKRGSAQLRLCKIKAELLIKTAIFCDVFFLLTLQEVGFKSFCLRPVVLRIRDQISPDVLVNAARIMRFLLSYL